MFGTDTHITSTSYIGYAGFTSEAAIFENEIPLPERTLMWFTLKHCEKLCLVMFENPYRVLIAAAQVLGCMSTPLSSVFPSTCHHHFKIKQKC